MNSLEIKDEEEYTIVLNALHRYGNFCFEMWEYSIQAGNSYTKEECDRVSRRKDLAFKLQERLRNNKDR